MISSLTGTQYMKAICKKKPHFYTTTEYLEIEIVNTIYNSSKNMKYFGINLKDVYTKSCKILKEMFIT